VENLKKAIKKLHLPLHLVQLATNHQPNLPAPSNSPRPFLQKNQKRIKKTGWDKRHRGSTHFNFRNILGECSHSMCKEGKREKEKMEKNNTAKKLSFPFSLPFPYTDFIPPKSFNFQEKKKVLHRSRGDAVLRARMVNGGRPEHRVV
jgi:hypothetical protein